MRTLSLLFALAGLLAGCASPAPPTALPVDLFVDSRFGPPGEPVDTRDVFTLSDAMRRYVDVDIGQQIRTEGVQSGLVEALYHRAQLKLEYDAAKTRNAAEAFDARAGNCLSLVIMTAAFAKELNLPVTYQSALLEETWSRDGSLLFASGHVNITLGPRLVDAGTMRGLGSLTIDFLPPEDIRRLRTLEISEATVVAMYANNRAAEAMARGHLDAAYAWSHEAIRVDPGFLPALNTLGVVYLQHGDFPEAARVFEVVLARDDNNTRALSNLAATYTRQGRTAEAAALRVRLAAVEPYPPFHFFNLGMAAMERHDFRAARDLFSREVDRAGYYHEFHFWLGVADWRLGDVEAARKHLALAMDNSTTRHQHDIYAAKLEWLRSTH